MPVTFTLKVPVTFAPWVPVTFALKVPVTFALKVPVTLVPKVTGTQHLHPLFDQLHDIADGTHFRQVFIG